MVTGAHTSQTNHEGSAVPPRSSRPCPAQQPCRVTCNARCEVTELCPAFFLSPFSFGAASFLGVASFLAAASFLGAASFRALESRSYEAGGTHREGRPFEAGNNLQNCTPLTGLSFLGAAFASAFSPLALPSLPSLASLPPWPWLRFCGQTGELSSALPGTVSQRHQSTGKDAHETGPRLTSLAALPSKTCSLMPTAGRKWRMHAHPSSHQLPFRPRCIASGTATFPRTFANSGWLTPHGDLSGLAQKCM